MFQDDDDNQDAKVSKIYSMNSHKKNQKKIQKKKALIMLKSQKL